MGFQLKSSEYRDVMLTTALIGSYSNVDVHNWRRLNLDNNTIGLRRQKLVAVAATAEEISFTQKKIWLKILLIRFTYFSRESFD